MTPNRYFLFDTREQADAFGMGVAWVNDSDLTDYNVHRNTDDPRGGWVFRCRDKSDSETITRDHRSK